MIEQLKTIREALQQAKDNTTHGQIAWNCKQALTALDQLEAMVGDQEPVAWLRKNGFRFLGVAEPQDDSELPLYAAPVAQQPSKATLEKLRAWDTNGELIDRAWQVLQSQEQEIMRLEKMLAEERAQQPQCHKKANDYCKCPRKAMLCDGVGPAQQPQAEAAHPAVKPDTLVNRGALQMALNVLRRAGKDEVADELEKTIQQPQAEAVPSGYVLVPIDVLEAASESLGSFVSDNGWTDLDMQAMNNLDAILAQQKGGV